MQGKKIKELKADIKKRHRSLLRETDEDKRYELMFQLNNLRFELFETCLEQISRRVQQQYFELRDSLDEEEAFYAGESFDSELEQIEKMRQILEEIRKINDPEDQQAALLNFEADPYAVAVANIHHILQEWEAGGLHHYLFPEKKRRDKKPISAPLDEAFSTVALNRANDLRNDPNKPFNALAERIGTHTALRPVMPLDNYKYTLSVRRDVAQNKGAEISELLYKHSISHGLTYEMRPGKKATLFKEATSRLLSAQRYLAKAAACIEDARNVTRDDIRSYESNLSEAISFLEQEKNSETQEKSRGSSKQENYVFLKHWNRTIGNVIKRLEYIYPENMRKPLKRNSASEGFSHVAGFDARKAYIALGAASSHLRDQLSRLQSLPDYSTDKQKRQVYLLIHIDQDFNIPDFIDALKNINTNGGIRLHDDFGGRIYPEKKNATTPKRKTTARVYAGPKAEAFAGQ